VFDRHVYFTFHYSTDTTELKTLLVDPHLAMEKKCAQVLSAFRKFKFSKLTSLSLHYSFRLLFKKQRRWTPIRTVLLNRAVNNFNLPIVREYKTLMNTFGSKARHCVQRRRRCNLIKNKTNRKHTRMVLFSDNELRTILSNNSLLAWNDKDDTMQDYIVQLIQEGMAVVALMSDDDDDVNKNLESLQDYLRENILPFIRDDEEEGDDDDNETTIRQLATSIMQLLEQKPQQQQHQTKYNSSVDASSTTDPSLPKVAQRLEQETRPFTMRTTMLKEDDTARTAAANDNSDPSNRKENLTSRRRQDKRKQKLALANKEQQQDNRIKTLTGEDEVEEEFVEDDATAWQECLQEGKQWGGRGHGGRGEYAAAVNSIRSNIHLTNVTISLPSSTSSNSGGGDLLQNATMDIQRGHRYGLVGRNGCGK
jgi:hypothetical protein